MPCGQIPAAPGKHRGGLGVALTYRCLRECRGNINFDRTVTPPWGLAWRQARRGERCCHRASDGTRETVQKATDVQFRVGDRITFLTAGGGGYGDPKKRSREHMEEDMARVLSPSAA